MHFKDKWECFSERTKCALGLNIGNMICIIHFFQPRVGSLEDMRRRMAATFISPSFIYVYSLIYLVRLNYNFKHHPSRIIRLPTRHGKGLLNISQSIKCVGD